MYPLIWMFDIIRWVVWERSVEVRSLDEDNLPYDVCKSKLDGRGYFNSKNESQECKLWNIPGNSVFVFDKAIIWTYCGT